MKKILTLLICVLLYCSANANVPTAIVVQTTDDLTEVFILNENTKFKFVDNEIYIIYPEGEYSITYDELRKIEYSEVSGINPVENEPTYYFSEKKLTVDATTTELEISLFTLGGETLYLRKVKASESVVIDFSGYKGIYILKINGTSHKLILK